MINLSDKKIPYSIESETALIGALLAKNDILDRLAYLTPQDFFSPVCQRIFSTIAEFYNDGKTASILTLRNKFDEDPDLKDKGGAKYLVHWVANAPVDPFAIARYIVELRRRRELIAALEAALLKLSDEVSDCGAIACDVASFCDAAVENDREWETLNGEQVTQQILDAMKNNFQPFGTGIPRLDDAMDGGIYPGKLYGFGGKKKHGKTILAGTISCNLAIAGVRHLFIACEMSPQEIHQRNLARIGEFYGSAFRTGYSQSADFNNRLVKAMHWPQKNILYRNAPGLTLAKLKSVVKRAIILYGIKGFFLDYWQLVNGRDTKRNTAEHLDEVAQWCADICRKYNIFGVVMAQINQEDNTRGGEGLRLACDQMYSIQRPILNAPGMWLEMMDTRYTKWLNVGDKDLCRIELNTKGPWFEQVS